MLSRNTKCIEDLILPTTARHDYQMVNRAKVLNVTEGPERPFEEDECIFRS